MLDILLHRSFLVNRKMDIPILLENRKVKNYALKLELVGELCVEQRV